nr:reverse transcriptase domain-containing protein [Tanacetum cinerariifolium]
MSTQKDIYAAGFENRPPMLNKDNYVSWSSLLLRYEKSKPNRKLIYHSIMHGPYVRRMILEPGDLDREVLVAKTFHKQTDDELTEKELKQIIKPFRLYLWIANSNANQNGNGNVVAARAGGDLDDIKEFNANCILMENLQETSISSTQTNKALVYDLDGSAELQLNELNELRDQGYENYLIYKEKMKKLHDSKIKNRIFNVGDRVLIFNSRLKIFLGKLKSHWSGPFTITQVFPYGTIELSQPKGPNFKVNGHRVKHYFGGDVPSKVVLDLQTFPMDK